MSGVEVLRVPLHVDLAGFVSLLRRLQVPHRVVEQGNEQVLWVADARLAEQIRRLYEDHPHGADAGQLPLPPAGSRADARGRRWLLLLRATPVTYTVLLLCLLVAVLSGFGERIPTVRLLTFLDFHVQGGQLFFLPLSHTLTQQGWRLFSPMLLHFGFLHLAMNALWYWELGRRIELLHKGIGLLALTLLFSLASNVAQYGYSGPSLFGGLSGVLYGLLGYIWILQKLSPQPVLQLPTGVVAMMLIWLLVCMTGVLGLLGFGAIANGAHVGGLLAGCLCGGLRGTLARLRHRAI